MELAFCVDGTFTKLALMPLPPPSPGAKTAVGPAYKLWVDGTYETLPPMPNKLPMIPPTNAPGGPPIAPPIAAPAAIVGALVVAEALMIFDGPEAEQFLLGATTGSDALS